MRPLTSIAALGLALALALAPAAGGQARDEVFVDPDSPAGVEYQLPIERARALARGGSSPPAAGAPGAPPALFGEGVEPAREGGSRRDGAPGAGGATGAPGAQPASAPNAAADGIRAAAAAPDGMGTGAVAGIAAAVILLGALAGLAWRRRSIGG